MDNGCGGMDEGKLDEFQSDVRVVLSSIYEGGNRIVNAVQRWASASGLDTL